MTSNGARGQFIAARQQKRRMTARKTADVGKDLWLAGKTARDLRKEIIDPSMVLRQHYNGDGRITGE